MRIGQKWALGIVAFLLVAGGAGYWWYIADSEPPATLPAFSLDIAQLRALADEAPGEKPAEIRVETIATFAFPAVAVVGGDGWNMAPLGAFSYQVVAPGGTVVIDSALPASQAGSLGATIDDDAYARMDDALAAAGRIVLTHEHLDHIGGLAAHSDPEALRPRLALTAEQVADPTRYGAFSVPMPPLFEGVTPLTYEGATAIAPGVVLVKAPGHTPGSQMIFVSLADGREVLFIGDIGWTLRNVETGRGRPRLMSEVILREDRDLVFAELEALRALHAAEPGIAIVPGHDRTAIEALVADGTLIAGFSL